MLVKVFLYFVAMCVAIGALLALLADPLFLRAPKDRDLISLFQAHRATFERLRQMAAEDSGVVSHFAESRLDVRLSEARRQEYKRLLPKVGSGLVITTSHSAVRFRLASGGLLAIGPGWLKGIEYVTSSVDREGTVVDDLDHPAALAAGGVYLRQIEPHWFVVFQNTH